MVECLLGYEGNAFSASGDAEADLLGITAVHPMREHAAAELARRSGAEYDFVGRFAEVGRLVVVHSGNHEVYRAGRDG